MPKEKQVLKPIQRLYRSNGIDQIMFGWVCGIRLMIPSANIKDIIEKFMDYNDLDENEYPLESAMTTFQRMWNFYKETKI